MDGGSSLCNTSANPEHKGTCGALKVLLQMSLPAPLETPPCEKRKALEKANMITLELDPSARLFWILVIKHHKGD